MRCKGPCTIHAEGRGHKRICAIGSLERSQNMGIWIGVAFLTTSIEAKQALLRLICGGYCNPRNRHLADWQGIRRGCASEEETLATVRIRCHFGSSQVGPPLGLGTN